LTPIYQLRQRTKAQGDSSRWTSRERRNAPFMEVGGHNMVHGFKVKRGRNKFKTRSL